MNAEDLAQEWKEWWKKHRLSGFCYKFDQRLGYEVYRWNETPVEAFTVLRYRVEFEDQTGISTGLSSEKFNLFTDEERKKWRAEQKDSDRLAEEYGFTFDADKNLKIWEANFHDGIAILAEQLARKKSVRREMEKDRRQFTEPEIEQQINALHPKAPDHPAAFHEMLRSNRE